MSSRVRFMLQDFGQGTCHTGRQAFMVLQDLYSSWEGTQGRNKAVRTIWVKASTDYIAAHPFSTHAFPLEVPDMEWQGPGRYRQVNKIVESQTSVIPPLPKGPKWLVALEMWERLEHFSSGRWRFFVSRDNRRQSWRRSLCNPYFQNWGFKPRAVRVKAKKANPKYIPAPARTRRVWDEIAGDLFRGPEAPIPRQAQTQGTQGQGQVTQGRARPRVGIWV